MLCEVGSSPAWFMAGMEQALSYGSQLSTPRGGELAPRTLERYSSPGAQTVKKSIMRAPVSSLSGHKRVHYLDLVCDIIRLSFWDIGWSHRARHCGANLTPGLSTRPIRGWLSCCDFWVAAWARLTRNRMLVTLIIVAVACSRRQDLCIHRCYVELISTIPGL